MARRMIADEHSIPDDQCERSDPSGITAPRDDTSAAAVRG
jgi:hypothetical protein